MRHGSANAARHLHRNVRRRLEIVRLELVVALDACDSMRWRSQLNAVQRRSLEAVLPDVLEAHDLSIDEILRRSIALAQNRLLDAVLEHCRALDDAWPAQRAAS